MLNYQIINTKEDLNEPWLVFIHGFTGTLEVWNPIVAQLKNSLKHRILLIDNLGSGKSPQPDTPYTSNLMAQEILSVFEQLNITKATLIGHSLGGAIAQHIAINRPELVSDLILLSSFGRLDNTARHMLTARYSLIEANVDKALVAKSAIPTLFGNTFTSNEENINIAIERTVKNPQTVVGMRGQLNACNTYNDLTSLHRIKAKTYIVTGSRDVLVNPAHSNELLNLIPDSSLTVIEGCGHMIPIESPTEISELITQVTQSHEIKMRCKL